MSSMQIETSIDIAAPVARVWSDLTSFATFGDWSRFVLSVRGELREGATLTVRLDDGGRPMTIRPKLVVVAPNQELRWKGKLGSPLIFGGEHYYRLAPLGDGRTRFTHGEAFTGVLAKLMWRTLDTRTRKAFGDFNDALRARAESA